MRHFFVCLALAMLSAASAAAQTANPIVEHYRAYRTALDAGDYATAEAEAQAALAASEARDGDGGRTVVLALNLATVRLRTDDSAGALEPARRAFALAEAGAAGVDPNLAALILGRVELAGQNSAGADRLRSVFASSGLSQLPPAEIFPAATQLGHWAFQQQDYATAELAWSVAAAHASGAITGETFGLGVSRSWQAAAIFYDEIGRRGRHRMNQDRAWEAYRLARESVEALCAISGQNSSEGVTFAMRAYAQALAIRGAIWVKLISDDQRPPPEMEAQGDTDGYEELAAPMPLHTPACKLHISAPGLSYPVGLMASGGIGAVSLLVRLDGVQVRETQVLASIGHGAFAEEVEDARVAVRVQDSSPPNCRMPENLITSIRFSMGPPQ
jgi:hypothetical protein